MKPSEIELLSGEAIRCESIRQWHTYGGLLEGLPVRQWNEVMLANLLKRERERWGEGGAPYLVPPPVRAIPYEGDYPFGIPEVLPGITCVARFSGRSPTAWKADLLIIWFQSEFAFPIDPAVMEHLAAIDWATLSTPYDP